VVNTEKEKHTMFNTILRQFTQLFTPNYQSRLEQYISAHRPTSVAEVEHLERQYSKSQHGGMVWNVLLILSGMFYVKLAKPVLDSAWVTAAGIIEASTTNPGQ
jgi:hypothetical protein